MKATLIVAAVVVVHLAVFASVGPEVLDAYRVASRMVFKVAAAGACFWAAGTLSRGDYMRRFWALAGGTFLLLTAAEGAVVRPLLGGAGDGSALLEAIFLAAGNAVSVAASAVLAYAYRAAGLGNGRPGRARLAWVAAAAIAIAVPSYGLWTGFERALATGAPGDWASAFSYVADALVFLLLVPVLRFALQLAGGKLARPWWAFAAATLAWLVFDALEPLAALAPGASFTVISGEAARTLGTLLSALAALFQRSLVADARAERTAAAAATAAE